MNSPRSIKGSISLFSFSPATIEENLTRLESEMFKSISPAEFINFVVHKDDKDGHPWILKMVQHTNKISAWVATEILLRRDIKEQLKILKMFIKVAKLAESHNNFNTTMEILSGLNRSSVQRLKYLWKVMISNSIYCLGVRL